MFGNGYVLEGDYIVTVENFASSDMYLVRNTDGDGVGEDLCLTYYRGLSDPSFDGWYSTFPFGPGWNFDMPFEPIIEYSFDSELTISADSICGSDTLIVFDTIVSFDDSVLYNKMYNPNLLLIQGIILRLIMIMVMECLMEQECMFIVGVELRSFSFRYNSCFRLDK